MKNYHQLTNEQRYQIFALKSAKHTQVEIANIIGCHKSTISRELLRNSGLRGYRPKQAQKLAMKRRCHSVTKSKYSPTDYELIERLIRQRYSPVQISKRTELENSLSISHETIYRYIHKDKLNKGELFHYLRNQKLRKKRYKSSHNGRGQIKNRIPIDDRDKSINDRQNLGDFEGDTVIGKNHKGAIVTIVDRKSRYLYADLLDNRTAANVTKSIVSMLSTHKCNSITFDNGKEFANHSEISDKLGANIFFAHPYSSFERGTNENTNGLLRQYYPKKTDFSKIDKSELQAITDELNHRPRKCLGYRSPYEVHNSIQLSYTSDITSVAIRS